jgi:hypothetical protein
VPSLARHRATSGDITRNASGVERWRFDCRADGRFREWMEGAIDPPAKSFQDFHFIALN